MRSNAQPKGGLRRSKQLRSYYLKENLELYSLFIPAAALILLFCYVPMWGIVIAFQDYLAGNSMFALDASVRWVGFKHFNRFISSIYFNRLIINTLRLSVLDLVFGFSLPILFALLLNEIRRMRYKKLVQTASYLPYFISTVVAAGMMLSFLEPNGLVNSLLHLFGISSKEYIAYPEYYPAIYTITNVWKNFGFDSILYFSTIAAISPVLYESARMDGANRLQQLWYITLPGIKFIIAVQLVRQMGHVLNSNTDLALLLQRSSTLSTSDVIGTYIYREGIQGGKYSYTTAIGLFQSVIGFVLTFVTNKISNKLTGYGMW